MYDLLSLAHHLYIDYIMRTDKLCLHEYKRPPDIDLVALILRANKPLKYLLPIMGVLETLYFIASSRLFDSLSGDT